ncbi:SGNH hydrolase-type esterase domain-containing protein [Colletotrichum navitas]|uniref:SGNH hydrolase-type esterase domain-containing protein n=1 Tax=Colletotrichum navitas TaxID=681940 RepID=A0AAD8PVT3_9PEZI|nr:SGNH hydrolase-type esterase domain-containing protein [Colletotrichum navitas]KAK1585590.1 SGNH hydrolase-type esterase domain-containing protein [Colletotrichum navitas]
MKAYCTALGVFACFVSAQNPSTAKPTAIEAIDQCTQSAFDACPADATAAHRCLKIERPSDGVPADQCVSSCAADSACPSACGQDAGHAWCDASGGCYCDRSWNSAQAAPADPKDLSWVKKWAAVGDSYSAGIGSGKLYPGSEEDCSRYDQSYPAYIQSHELMPQNPPAAFEFLSCSGATAPEVLANQVVGMGTGYDVITVSAGGNDVGLTKVLNACIFQWNPLSSCPSALRVSSALIRDVLPGNLDRLYAGLRDKINPERKVYVTGYAAFFDNSTRECDDVSWAFWYNLDDKEHLTLEHRTLMNELTLATNAAIQAAVQRAGDAFEYVGYNEYFSALQGRFCEAGVKEPDANRNGLLFFEWETKSDDPTLLGRREIAAPELSGAIPRTVVGDTELPAPEARGDLLSAVDVLQKRAGQTRGSLRRGEATGGDPGTRAAVALQGRQAGGSNNRTNVSFEKYITDAITEAHAQNPSLVAAVPGNNATALPASWGHAKLAVGGIVSDNVKRVFHPRPGGHAIIANLVIWRMTEGTVAAQNSPTNATETAGGAVPVS